MNWEAFWRYLSAVYDNQRTARGRFNYARRYGHCLFSENLSELRVLTDDKRGHVLRALSILAKYLGVYQRFRQLLADYGLKWSGRKDHLILKRMAKIKDPDEIYQWIKEVKRVIPELSNFMDFIAVTGLRLVEAVRSHNLIIELQGKLGEYYNANLNTLQHYKFPEMFIRSSKKCFVSFVPEEMVERIKNRGKIISENAILMKFRKRAVKSRFGDVREAHASVMTKHLSRPEIDFLHGRIGTSIFMQHYFNPALLSDLKQRVFEGIKEIQAKIS